MLRFLPFILVTLGAYAGQVTLANGDRISGSVRKLADGKLFVVSDMAGPIAIPWSNVATLQADEPLHIVSKSGKTLVGAMELSVIGARVQEAAGPSDVAREEIVAIRSAEEQQSYEEAERRKEFPTIRDRWTGFVDAGLSATRGNSDTTAYSVALGGVRATTRDKLTMNFNSLYAHNSSLLPVTVTANLRRGGARYELNLNEREFTFASADAEFNEAQKLDLRTVGGLGFGHHVVKNPRATLDLFAGGTANRELFSTGLARLTAEALLSQESSYKVGPLLTLKEKFSMYPNLSDTGEFRYTFDSTAVTTLLRWLAVQVTLSDRHSSDPLPGTLQNDLLLTTGLRFSLLPPKR